MLNYKNYAIMKEFIYSNELAMLKIYGITIRLNVIFIDNKASLWIVTKRTINKKEEETWSFQEFTTASIKFKDLISQSKTSWCAEIANNI